MRMMNIVLSFNFLFSTLISVCVTARLTDDQLAQILSDKLSTGPLRDSREYPSIDDLTEFDRRLVALEKIDEVADRLLDDELQTDEDFADGPKFDSNRMVQNSEDSGEAVSEPERYLFDVTDIHKDDAFNEQHKIKSSLKVCIEYSFTQQEFEKCLRRHKENKFSTINGLKEKRVGFSTCGTYGNRCKTKEGEKETGEEKGNPLCGRFGCRGKSFEKEIGEEKRNPFCGRFGCRGKRFEKEIGEEKRNPFCGRFGCRGKRFEKEIGEEKRNPFCGRFGCRGKRFEKEIGEEKRNPFCGRFGCRGKRFEKEIVEEKRNPFCGRFGCRGKRFEKEIGEEKRNPFCGRFGCRGKRFEKEIGEEKRNPFCGRFGCRGKRFEKEIREEKRNPFCGRFGCRGKRFEKEIGEEKRNIFFNKNYPRPTSKPKQRRKTKQKSKEKKNPFCSHYGCYGKRFAFFNRYPGKRQHSVFTDKKDRESVIPDERGILRNLDQHNVLFQTSEGFEASQTDSSDDSEEYNTQNKLKDVQLKEDLRRVIGSMCNTSINGCQFKKEEEN
ncbi:uncharacterized protein LOC132756570 isoform X2 [Ruditapes philippinarum]|uniref:uncharacterized protein LOC132756570 isoform X2 n=1 Tax=Ruditapes philippinarum TaxID=129788 RepID=UPI00295BC158|nr:uncharacterized protein LOC132756570 isoform X2 [Ruditapes philippinarum]